jgi:hypothetical protein
MTDDDDQPEGQIISLHSEERNERIWGELVALKRNSPAKYAHRKRDVQAILHLTLEEIDDEVKHRLNQQDVGSEAERSNLDLKDLLAVGHTRSIPWQDDSGVALATFERDGHLEHWPMESREYRDWLCDEFLAYRRAAAEEWQANKDTIIVSPLLALIFLEILMEKFPHYPPKEEVNKAVYQLSAYARRQAKRKPARRLCSHANALWIDLGRQDWQGVRVTAEGWDIVPKIEAPLIRGQGMSELPLPKSGGNIRALREFANVRDDEDFVLFCGTAVGLFNPWGHYTTTIFCGPAGSGKTTATLVMRRLCDPNKVSTQAYRNVRDLMHGAASSPWRT